MSGITSIPLYWAHSPLRCLIASGLLFSTPIIHLSTERAFIRIVQPTKISSPCSSISWWSLVKYGSHSTALIIKTSALLPGGGESLTCVGNVAPPRPTIPASLILSMIALASSEHSRTNSGLRSIDSSQTSSSATLMIIAGFL